MRSLRRIISPGIKPARTLILPENLKDVKNPYDGRVISKLDKPINIELMDKMELGNDSFVYRFALPGRDSCLGHATC
jgi:hypothetical protein